MLSTMTTGQYSALSTSSCSRQRIVDQLRPGDHERQHDDADDQPDDVQGERQHPGPDDPSTAAEAVHDRDGVDEDVQRTRARPQGQHEADRDDVETLTRSAPG